MAQISWPFDQSRISEGYGYAEWRGGIHDGIDFAIGAGTELRAAASGTVYNNDAGADGAGVDITTDDGWKVRMWHVSQFLVANGSYVNAGDVIALSGGIPGTWGAGRTTGPHMHFGVKVAGSWIDPAAVINGSVSSAPATGSVTELAQAVMRGDFGNGPARQAALGGRFDEVQAEVNRLLGGGAPAPAPTPVSVEELAQAVLRGDFGNGPDRVAALGARYDEVQAEVNRILSGESPAPAPAPAPEPVVTPEPTPEPVEEAPKPVEPERKKPIIKPTPPKKKEPIMTKKEEQAALAALPSVDLGVIIPTVKARKIAYIVFAAVAFVVTNIGVGFAAAGMGWPVWLVVTVAVTNNMAPLFATLAVANASNKK